MSISSIVAFRQGRQNKTCTGFSTLHPKIRHFWCHAGGDSSGGTFHSAMGSISPSNPFHRPTSTSVISRRKSLGRTIWKFLSPWFLGFPVWRFLSRWFFFLLSSSYVGSICRLWGDSISSEIRWHSILSVGWLGQRVRQKDRVSHWLYAICIISNFFLSVSKKTCNFAHSKTHNW